LRFVPRAAVRLDVSDLVEVVGFPELGGPSPVLREALVKQTGRAELPTPLKLSEEPWPVSDLDATRVLTEALLLNLSKDQQDQVFGLQAGPHVFVARLPVKDAAGVSFPVGSRLQLTGTIAGRMGDRSSGREVASFELLLNSPADVRLLARPVWSTLRRMIIIVGVLVGVLLAAMVWITMLRKQVDQRSAQLRVEIQERERAEKMRAIEAERSRIARDLHDDLGSSLTEISLLADAGLGNPPSPERALSRFRAIAAKARALVQALDVIVWLVNPSKDALPFLVGYLGSYAEEFLGASGLGCRLKIPMDMPALRLSADVRHNLFLAVKEVLHNVVRHAHASEVRVTFALRDGVLEIAIADNGQGFDPSTPVEGNGLANLRQRLAGIGGRCEIQAQPGAGATVRLVLPLPANPQPA
jgi:signal transduction histidine kinase